jgi:pimeloyl-ACP methyl ester carboxylesterase
MEFDRAAFSSPSRAAHDRPGDGGMASAFAYVEASASAAAVKGAFCVEGSAAEFEACRARSSPCSYEPGARLCVVSVTLNLRTRLMAELPKIVLVHGAWADGSCWSAVIERLQADGYDVTAPQLPETSLADDVARVRQVLERQDAPTVLVGHSYGGQVITSLGTDAPNVVGLVYIAAFGLDEGESIGALLQQGPPPSALANLEIDSRGFARIPENDFVGHFAGDIDPVKAKVMYAVQQPLHTSTLEDVMGEPAWKSLPAWYLVATKDEAIPPDAQRQFAARMGAETIEVESGHCAMVSHPEETVERIVTAAKAAAVAA